MIHDVSDPARTSYETLAVRHLADVARARGWGVEVEPGTRFAARLTLPSGRRHLVVGADLGLNTSSARRVAQDKAFAAHFLELDGLPTVPTRVVANAREAALAVAYPCVIKPNRSHGARGLSVVEREADLAPAIDAARAVDPITLLQPFDPRPEHRIILLGGDLVAAFRKERSTPLAPANLAAGATWTEETAGVHPRHLDTARRALASLGLTFAAVDLFADDLAQPGPGAILEVNATPGLRAISGLPGVLDRLFEGVALLVERGV